jgi:hypothetical protein
VATAVTTARISPVRQYRQQRLTKLGSRKYQKCERGMWAGGWCVASEMASSAALRIASSNSCAAAPCVPFHQHSLGTGTARNRVAPSETRLSRLPASRSGALLEECTAGCMHAWLGEGVMRIECPHRHHPPHRPVVEKHELHLEHFVALHEAQQELQPRSPPRYLGPLNKAAALV